MLFLQKKQTKPFTGKFKYKLHAFWLSWPFVFLVNNRVTARAISFKGLGEFLNLIFISENFLLRPICLLTNLKNPIFLFIAGREREKQWRLSPRSIGEKQNSKNLKLILFPYNNHFVSQLDKSFYELNKISPNKSWKFSYFK